MVLTRQGGGCCGAQAFNRDGSSLATGGADCTVRLWDLETYGSTPFQQVHKGTVHAVAWHPHRSILASGYRPAVYPTRRTVLTPRSSTVLSGHPKQHRAAAVLTRRSGLQVARQLDHPVGPAHGAPAAADERPVRSPQQRRHLALLRAPDRPLARVGRRRQQHPLLEHRQRPAGRERARGAQASCGVHCLQLRRQEPRL
eukprot:3926020-Rhodomonas_salina.4